MSTAAPDVPGVAAGAPGGASVLVERISRTFEGRIHALREVSLELRPGEAVALSGPSGSGKSTLLQIIGGLDRPDSGRVLVAGQSIGDMDRLTSFRRSTVGFVFQLHHLILSLDAQTNVEVPMIATGVGRRDRRRRALDLLEEVGLGHRANHLPSQLSGGERQRVAVARALANRPRLLLADEPTGALDSQTSERVLALIREIRDRHGMTVLVVSYDPAVGRYADRAVYMLDGRLVPDPAVVSAGPERSPVAGE